MRCTVTTAAAARASLPRARTAPCGVTAAELVERSPHRNGSTALSAGELERWLLEAGFAEPNGAPGRLVPTDRARDLVKLLGVNV